MEAGEDDTDTAPPPLVVRRADLLSLEIETYIDLSAAKLKERFAPDQGKPQPEVPEAPKKPAGQSSSNGRRRTLSGMQQPDDDDDDLSPGNWSTSQPRIPLASLFDFQKENWINIHERSAHRSLNEELEPYEMLDMDPEGEDDDGLDDLGLDKTAEDILSI
ncbi:hypothetical protein B0H10DRAFT_2237423 [Mycena sp. CBHHK59/15]|nr:hypothetical protein B0H10DRAFT_2237423 [Mycena sp. CBHHK59/15]